MGWKCNYTFRQHDTWKGTVSNWHRAIKQRHQTPQNQTTSWKNILLAKTDLNTALCHRQCLLPLPPLCSWQSAQLRMLASLRLECSFTQCFESSLNSWGILSNSIESEKFEFKCKQLTQVKLRWPWPETPIAWFPTPKSRSWFQDLFPKTWFSKSSSQNLAKASSQSTCLRTCFQAPGSGTQLEPWQFAEPALLELSHPVRQAPAGAP